MVHFSIGPIGAAALGLITLPFVAWFFSVEDVGRLTMLQVVLGLSVSLFSLAMQQAYVREYNEEIDKQALFKTSVAPGIAVLSTSIAIILILPFSVSNTLFGIESEFLTFLLILAIFFSFLISFLAHVVRMQEKGLVFSTTQIAPKLFLLIFISLILLLNLKAEFETLMLMNTLALTVSLIIFASLTRDTWKPAISKTINKKLLKRMLRFSLPLVVGGMAYWGLTTMDRIFLRTLVGFEELGVYALTISLANAVSLISTVFSNLWHPIVYRWVKNGVDPEKVQRVIENILLLVATIWSFVGIFSWTLSYFLPVDYEAVEYLLVACVAMPLFYILSETTVVGIGITRLTNFAMIASMVAFLVNAVLNYIFIPSYGASGAALATVVSFFVFFAIRTESSSWVWFSLPRLKIYFVLILYMLATTVMVLTQARIDYFNVVWFMLVILTIILFYSRLSESVNYVKNYLNERR